MLLMLLMFYIRYIRNIRNISCFGSRFGFSGALIADHDKLAAEENLRRVGRRPFGLIML